MVYKVFIKILHTKLLIGCMD